MNRILTTVLFLLVVSFTFAQDKVFSFGLKGSPGLGWMKPDVSLTELQKTNLPDLVKKSYDSKGVVVAFSYGVIAEFAFAKNYSFATGFDIAYGGGKLEYPSAMLVNGSTTDGNLVRTYAVKYLHLPLMLKMKTKEIGYITYFAQVGLGSAFQLSAYADDEFFYNLNAAKESILTKDINLKSAKDVSFFRESLIIGAGIEYSLGGSTRILAGLNFNNGFTDVLSGENMFDTSIKEKAISNLLEMNLGILF